EKKDELENDENNERPDSDKDIEYSDHEVISTEKSKITTREDADETEYLMSGYNEESKQILSASPASESLVSDVMESQPTMKQVNENKFNADEESQNATVEIVKDFCRKTYDTEFVEKSIQLSNGVQENIMQPENENIEISVDFENKIVHKNMTEEEISIIEQNDSTDEDGKSCLFNAEDIKDFESVLLDSQKIEETEIETLKSSSYVADSESTLIESINHRQMNDRCTKIESVNDDAGLMRNIDLVPPLNSCNNETENTIATDLQILSDLGAIGIKSKNAEEEANSSSNTITVFDEINKKEQQNVEPEIVDTIDSSKPTVSWICGESKDTLPSTDTLRKNEKDAVDSAEFKDEIIYDTLKSIEDLIVCDKDSVIREEIITDKSLSEYILMVNDKDVVGTSNKEEINKGDPQSKAATICKRDDVDIINDEKMRTAQTIEEPEEIKSSRRWVCGESDETLPNKSISMSDRKEEKETNNVQKDTEEVVECILATSSVTDTEKSDKDFRQSITYNDEEIIDFPITAVTQLSQEYNEEFLHYNPNIPVIRIDAPEETERQMKNLNDTIKHTDTENNNKDDSQDQAIDDAGKELSEFSDSRDKHRNVNISTDSLGKTVEELHIKNNSSNNSLSEIERMSEPADTDEKSTSTSNIDNEFFKETLTLVSNLLEKIDEKESAKTSTDAKMSDKTNSMTGEMNINENILIENEIEKIISGEKETSFQLDKVKEYEKNEINDNEFKHEGKSISEPSFDFQEVSVSTNVPNESDENSLYNDKDMIFDEDSNKDEIKKLKEEDSVLKTESLNEIKKIIYPTENLNSLETNIDVVINKSNEEGTEALNIDILEIVKSKIPQHEAESFLKDINSYDYKDHMHYWEQTQSQNNNETSEKSNSDSLSSVKDIHELSDNSQEIDNTQNSSYVPENADGSHQSNCPVADSQQINHPPDDSQTLKEYHQFRENSDENEKHPIDSQNLSSTTSPTTQGNEKQEFEFSGNMNLSSERNNVDELIEFWEKVPFVESEKIKEEGDHEETYLNYLIEADIKQLGSTLKESPKEDEINNSSEITQNYESLHCAKIENLNSHTNKNEESFIDIIELEKKDEVDSENTVTNKENQNDNKDDVLNSQRSENIYDKNESVFSANMYDKSMTGTIIEDKLTLKQDDIDLEKPCSSFKNEHSAIKDDKYSTTTKTLEQASSTIIANLSKDALQLEESILKKEEDLLKDDVDLREKSQVQNTVSFMNKNILEESLLLNQTEMAIQGNFIENDESTNNDEEDMKSRKISVLDNENIISSSVAHIDNVVERKKSSQEQIINDSDTKMITNQKQDIKDYATEISEFKDGSKTLSGDGGYMKVEETSIVRSSSKETVYTIEETIVKETVMVKKVSLSDDEYLTKKGKELPLQPSTEAQDEEDNKSLAYLQVESTSIYRTSSIETLHIIEETKFKESVTDEEIHTHTKTNISSDDELAEVLQSRKDMQYSSTAMHVHKTEEPIIGRKSSSNKLHQEEVTEYLLHETRNLSLNSPSMVQKIINETPKIDVNPSLKFEAIVSSENPFAKMDEKSKEELDLIRNTTSETQSPLAETESILTDFLDEMNEFEESMDNTNTKKLTTKFYQFKSSSDIKDEGTVESKKPSQ
ncbi:unnamed protein product, partial [Meganyctiphanes norvegica]